MPDLRLGAWQVLSPGAGGEGAVTLDGDRTAVASQRALLAWTDDRPHAAQAPWPAPGRPRFAGDRVLWGPGILDLASGAYAPLDALRPAIVPGGGETPQWYAWSASGDRVLVSVTTGEASTPTRVTLCDGRTGRAIATLAHSGEMPPRAAWLGARGVIAGFRDPRVFDSATGASIGSIPLGAGVVTRLDADDSERRVIAVDQNRAVSLIDPAEWRVLDRWEGHWRDAAISPDGSVAAALELDGTLRVATLSGDRFHAIGEPAVVPGATSIALTTGAIGVAGGGGVAARATLAVE